MDISEAFEQSAALACERPRVDANQLAERLVGALFLSGLDDLFDGDDQRRVADDAPVSVDDLGQLAERLEAVLRSRVGDVFREPLLLLAGRPFRELADDGLDVDPALPQFHVVHGGEPPHRLAIGATDRRVDPGANLRLETAVAAGDGKTCDEALHIRLERSREGLVEVVDAEQHRRSGAAKAPQFERGASPESWACKPVLGASARSAAMSAAPPR